MTTTTRLNLSKFAAVATTVLLAAVISLLLVQPASADTAPADADLAAGQVDLVLEQGELSAQSSLVLPEGSVRLVEWSRLQGQTALDTMAAIVRAGWQQSEVAVIATSDGYWDALAASALAGANGAPVLFTDKSELSSQTRSEIERLGVKHVYIAGGTAAVSAEVESQLASLGVQVKRLWGERATSTAVAIAGALGDARGSTCIIATSEGYWDALSASPYAYAAKAPIYLTGAGNVLDDETVSAIRGCGYSKALIAGGTAAVSADVETQLASCGIADVNRCWGQTAYDTAAELAAWEVSQGMSWVNLGIATGNGYWDALAGAALCGKNNAVLMLADDEAYSQAWAKVAENKETMGFACVFGGSAAVGDDAYIYLQNATIERPAGWRHRPFGKGHWEYVCVEEAYDAPEYEMRAVCNGCGADWIEVGGFSHVRNGGCPAGGSGFASARVQVGTIHHDAVYEEQWVVDASQGTWDDGWLM